MACKVVEPKTNIKIYYKYACMDWSNLLVLLSGKPVGKIALFTAACKAVKITLNIRRWFDNSAAF